MTRIGLQIPNFTYPDVEPASPRLLFGDPDELVGHDVLDLGDGPRRQS